MPYIRNIKQVNSPIEFSDSPTIVNNYEDYTIENYSPSNENKYGESKESSENLNLHKINKSYSPVSDDSPTYQRINISSNIKYKLNYHSTRTINIPKNKIIRHGKFIV